MLFFGLFGKRSEVVSSQEEYERRIGGGEWEVEEVTIEKDTDGEFIGMNIRGPSICCLEYPFTLVSKIVSDGAVSRNGRIRLGDVLMKVNDVNCFGVHHFVIVEAFKNAGNTVRLKVTRRLKSTPLEPPLSVNEDSLDGETADYEKCLKKKHKIAIDTHVADMRKLFEDGRFTDFIIRTSDRREICSHRLILRSTSPYFEGLFGLDGVEAHRGEMEVPEPYETMVKLVGFLYTGKWFPAEETAGIDDGLFDLLDASDKYQVDTLKALVECTMLSVENVCETLVLATVRGNLELKTKAVDFIRANQHNVWKTDGWSMLCQDNPDLVAEVFFPSAKSKQKESLV